MFCCLFLIEAGNICTLYSLQYYWQIWWQYSAAARELIMYTINVINKTCACIWALNLQSYQGGSSCTSARSYFCTLPSHQTSHNQYIHICITLPLVLPLGSVINNEKIAAKIHSTRALAYMVIRLEQQGQRLRNRV